MNLMQLNPATTNVKESKIVFSKGGFLLQIDLATNENAITMRYDCVTGCSKFCADCVMVGG